MSVTFGPLVVATKHAGIREFLTSDKVDDDLDVVAAARSTETGTYANVTQDWHPDKQGDHLTVEVFIKGKQLYTAHVYLTGQITAFS